MSDHAIPPSTPPPAGNSGRQPVDVFSNGLPARENIDRSANTVAPSQTSQPPDQSTPLPEAFSTPLRPGPSSRNQFAFTPLTDKKLGMALVDVNGMAARFIELSIEQFDKLIPGTPPTDDQREHFYAPKLEKTKSSSVNGSIAGKEVSLYPEVTRTVQSVLDATGKEGTKLRYLEHPNDKARDGTNKSTDTVNDGGIYLNTEAARAATTKTTSRRGKKQPIEQPEHRGCRSWNYMAVPFEIKYDPLQSAFYTLKPDPPSSSKEPKKGSKEAERASIDPTAPSGSHATSETQSTSRGRGKRGSAGKGRGRGGGKGRGKGQGKGKAKASPSPSMPPPPMPTPDPSTPDSGSVDPEQPSTTPPAASAACPKQHTFIRDSIKGEEALAQFAEYMFNVFKYQHRVSAWAVYITFDNARLLFFDRVGAFVSQSFDWTKTDSLLHTFIWRLAQMSDERLGYDPTVTYPKPAELEQLNKAKSDCNMHSAIRKLIDDQMGNGFPLRKLCVTSYSTRAEDAFPDEDYAADLPHYPQPKSSSTEQPPVDDSTSWEHRHFIIGRPQFTADSLIGRCGRGYVAFDLQDNQFYYLKDLWRSWVPGKIRPEHLIYERLHKHKVRGIAPLICGGDVGGPRGQVTSVQQALPAENRPVPRVHYRIVVGKIGLSLFDFTNFAELAKILRGALATHYIAWTRAKVLHRDVSVGNILIDPETRKAILIDWDLSRLECELPRQAAEPDRTGTWQFRSGLSLRYPRKPYCVADDVESFVHVFHYLILRFHHTDVSRLFNEVDTRYQCSEVINGIKVGGRAKIRGFSQETPQFNVERNNDLQNVLNALAIHCYNSYSHIDHKHMDRVFGMAKEQASLTGNGNKKSEDVEDGEDELPDLPPLELVESSRPSNNQFRPGQYEVDGFLCNQGYLIDLLKTYTAEVEDKQEDQFKLRAGEDAGPGKWKIQHIGYLSATASHLGEGDIALPALSAESAPYDLESAYFTHGPTSPPTRQSSPDMISHIPSYAFEPSVGPSVGTSSMGGTRESQKRPREEGEGEDWVGDRFEEGDSDVRPVKRRGTRTT